MKQIMISVLCLFCVSQQIIAQQKPISALLTTETKSLKPSTLSFDMSTSSDSRKSVFLAVAASLLVPGLGEWYAGSFETGKYNLMAEGGLWLTYAGFRTHAQWLQQDAETFAKQHAGADFSNKDDYYSVNIGNFNTTDEYNAAKGINREYDLVYRVNISPDYQWSWDTEANRTHFRDMRIHSGEVKNRAKFVLGAVVVNHILSAFFAGKKAAAYNKALSAFDKIEIRTYALNNDLHSGGWGISITTQF
jgi:hypothetical protein